MNMMQPQMYINILLDSALAIDVNKYSLVSASCPQRWQTNLGNWIYFSCRKGLWDCLVLTTKPSTTKHQFVFWLVSQSQRMSAIFVGGYHLWQLVLTLWMQRL